MSQATVEAGIISTILLNGEFTATNTKLYDRRPLAKGLSKVVVVSYNSDSREQLTLQVERRKWNYNVDVLVPWRGELTELDIRVGVEAAKVIAVLGSHPRLNGTTGVQRADVSTVARPDLIMEAKGVYRGRRHTLEVLEYVNPGRAE